MSRTAIWLANGVLVVLCCFLAASILTEVAAEVMVATPAGALPATPSAAPRVERGWEQRQVILTRNLFNVSTLTPTPEETPDPGPDLEKTALKLRLLATVAGAAAHSWAAVEDLDSREVVVVRVEDRLQERADVVAIERRRIVLRNQGKLEELALDEDAPGARPSPPRRTARRARGNSRGRVQRLGQDRFSVARSDVRSVAQNPAELFSQARILPKYEDGQMTGVQINAIKPGSLFQQIGIQNGDVIREFNGIEITNQQDSAAVLREFTKAEEFNVRVIGENGRERTYTYELRN